MDDVLRRSHGCSLRELQALATELLQGCVLLEPGFELPPGGWAGVRAIFAMAFRGERCVGRTAVKRGGGCACPASVSCPIRGQ